MKIVTNCYQSFVCEGIVYSFRKYENEDRASFVLIYANSDDNELYITPIFCIIKNKQLEIMQNLGLDKEGSFVSVQGKLRYYSDKKYSIVIDRILPATKSIVDIDNKKIYDITQNLTRNFFKTSSSNIENTQGVQNGK